MIYFFEAVGLNRVKIGFASTDRNLGRRFESAHVMSPVDVRLVGVLPGELAAEKALHLRFHEHRIRGEWFALDAVLRQVTPQPWVSSLTCTVCGTPKSIQATAHKPTPRCVACQRRARAIECEANRPRCGKCGVAVKSKYALHDERRAAGTTNPIACRKCAPTRSIKRSEAMRVAWQDPAYKAKREASRLATLARKRGELQ